MDRCERGSAWKEGRRTRDKRRRRTTGHLLTYIGKGLGETLTLTPMERLPWICVCVCERERRKRFCNYAMEEKGYLSFGYSLF